MWVLQTLEWGQMAPRTGVEATAGCPSSIPTTDLGLADPILSFFEVFCPNFCTVQPKGL
jgi:hypothetical protein